MQKVLDRYLRDTDREKIYIKRVVNLKREEYTRKALKRIRKRRNQRDRTSRGSKPTDATSKMFRFPGVTGTNVTVIIAQMHSGEMSPNQQSCVSNKGRDNVLCYQAHIHICGDISHYWKSILVTTIKSKVI